MIPRKRYFVLAIIASLGCLSFFLAEPLSAQSQAINGTIRGRITDPAGAAVPEANVTVTNINTGFRRTVPTETEGYFVVPSLPLGTYTVSVEKQGFSTVRHPDIVLEAGKEAVIDEQLKVGEVATILEVTGGGPVIEPTRINTGRTIDQREIVNLPLTSRNPYNLILFQPGVSGHPNQELGIPRTINTNGQLDRINYQMDGMVDTQSDRHGLRLFPISEVYVREIQTVSNGFAPEFGGTTGNIFNVITNSGTNNLHGMFQYIRRSVDATARPLLLNPVLPKPNLALTDYSTNAGGPIIHNKLFFFGGYEHLTRGVPTSTTINASDAARLGIAPALLATAPSILHGQFLNGRADWNISQRHQMFFRYNYFRNNFPFNTGVGSLNSLETATDFRDRAHVIGSQLISTISPRLLNEFRFSWAMRDNTHFPSPTAGAGPQIAILGVAFFGGPNTAGDRFQEKLPNWNDNVTYLHGSHSMKFGVSMSAIQDLQRDVSFARYTFSGKTTEAIQKYLDAKSGKDRFSYSNFSARSDPSGVSYSSLFWGFYAQDSWQTRPSLLVTYGFRYDRYRGPDANPNAPYPFSRNFTIPNSDFAPRLGLAWRLGTKTVIRASTGIYYEASPTNLWFNTLNQDGSNRTRNISVGPKAGPAFPDAPIAGGTQTQDVTTITPDYKNAYVISSSLQVTRELSANDALTIGYVHTSGRQLAFLRNINLINPIGTLADGRPVFGSARRDARFNNVLLQDVGANSDYNAMLLTYQHRFSHDFQVTASYTLSHTISDAPDVNSFEQNLPIEDATNRRRDRGNSTVNRPHAFTVSTVFDPKVNIDQHALRYLLNGNLFAVLGNISSGDQQNITAGSSLNGDATTTNIARPVFIGRNTARGPAIYQIDLRYTRTVLTLRERLRAQFLVEVNNLFNHPNITLLKTVVPVNDKGEMLDVTGTPTRVVPTFFQPQTTVLEGRIVQFGLALRW
ncbi:MAG TPA: TonB-dependent receptor [Candidatus Dormibacteraeota bacterium]|nr:TonB-dependent receptor [Candidatus Dormibacteraeota bacterium]HXN23875.1 TonB-dependent receptor [Candidatus Dormibacteraeota bacterium]